MSFPVVPLSLWLYIETKREEDESYKAKNHAICRIAFGFSLSKNL